MLGLVGLLLRCCKEEEVAPIEAAKVPGSNRKPLSIHCRSETDSRAFHAKHFVDSPQASDGAIEKGLMSRATENLLISKRYMNNTKRNNY